MLTFNTDTPILLLAFNRPELTRRVFEAIKKAAPKRLYVAADGPRGDQDLQKCKEVRDIVESITWDCKFTTLFRDRNLGCGKAVSEGITWFFEHEIEGIILEDDCLPVPSFFGFCSHMLAYFRNDTRVGHISGSNFQDGIGRGDGSYYFSELTHVWGWAGWRRVWKDYDFNISSFSQFEKSFTAYPSHQPFAERWTDIFTKVYQGKIDTWDYQYAYLNLAMNYAAVMPNVNLIENIGIGNEATHTNESHPLSNKPAYELTSIVHPVFRTVDVAADLYTQNLEFNQPVRPQKSLISRTWKKIRGRG